MEERAALLKQAVSEINVIAEQLKKISIRIGSTISVMSHPEQINNCIFVHDTQFVGEDEILDGATVLRSRPEEKNIQEEV